MRFMNHKLTIWSFNEIKVIKIEIIFNFLFNTSYLKLRTYVVFSNYKCSNEYCSFFFFLRKTNIAVKYLNSVKIEGPTSNCKSFTNIAKACKNDKIVTNIQLQHGYQYLVHELCRLVDFKAC